MTMQTEECSEWTRDDKRRAQIAAAQKCANMMKMARNDTDRIAVLALIPKLMVHQQNEDDIGKEKDVSTNDAATVLIADAIPVDFLERLFDSTDRDGHILAIRVLAQLLTSTAAVSSGKFNDLSSRIVDALKRAFEMKSEDIFNDILFCCIRLCDNVASLEKFWHILIECIQVERPEVMDAAFGVYEAALQDSAATVELEQLHSRLNHFLNALISRIRNDDTPLHFQMLDHLVLWWMRLRNNSLPLNRIPSSSENPAWIQDLRAIIRAIFQSRRTGDRERRIALSLATGLTCTFGLRWLNTDAQLLQLIASIASIDIRVTFEKETMKEDQSPVWSSSIDPVYIAGCCQLLEAILRHAVSHAEATDETSTAEDASDGPSLTEGQVLQINRTLLDLTNFLLEFFAVMDERQKQPPSCISFPLYRFICAYFAEGLALVGKENLIAAAKWLLNLNHWAMKQRDESQYFDSMALLIPALSELIDLDEEWDCVKKAFMANGLVHLLEGYIHEHEDMADVYQDILQRFMTMDKD